MSSTAEPQPLTLTEAVIPVASLVVLVALSYFLFGDAGASGPNQVALTFATMVAVFIGWRRGHSLESLREAAVQSVGSGIGAMFILLAVGTLIGAWALSGTLLAMVYYGLQLLNPNYFYVTATAVCAIVAASIGSSWTVVGTIGIGFMGIAMNMELNPAIAAAAIISGAYFGDKMSPLSETTNLAPAVAGTDLYTHIRGMMWTAIPSILIAMVIFGIIGLRTVPAAPIDLTVVLDVMENIFNITLLTLIPLLVVLFMSFKRIAAFATIMAGALAGGLTAVILQPEVVTAFVHDPSLSTPLAMIKGVWMAMATGFTIETGYGGIDILFSRGGMSSMLNTVWLILSALAFGGVLEYTGLLARLMLPVVNAAKSDRSLVAATGLTAIGLNIVAGDQYMAVVLPGRMYRQLYEERGIAPETLSREIEDTGTITSPLVPWNSCGAYMAATLGIATAAYLPYCLFNLTNVVISFAYAFFGFQIKHTDPEAARKPAPDQLTLYGLSNRRAEPTTPEPAIPV